MKYLLVFGFAAVCLNAYAQNKVIKCEADRKGAVCCWDTAQYGPYRPWICD
jgi:hypothetical protein